MESGQDDDPTNDCVNKQLEGLGTTKDHSDLLATEKNAAQYNSYLEISFLKINNLLVCWHIFIVIESI